MRRKLILLSGALLLALVVTTGTYAYTYNVATATLDVAAVGGEIVMSEMAPDQPEWDYMLPESEYNSEILIPDGAGDQTSIPSQCPDMGEHWDKVDDMPADDVETYISTWHVGNYRTDLYNLTDHSEGEGAIAGVTVHFRFAGFEDGGEHNGYAKAVIQTNGTIYEGSEETQIGTTFVTRSYQWTVNPNTGSAWTWDEIDALQAGVSLKGEKPFWPALCTQVYVAVDYEVLPITQGQVPAGGLFTITPNPQYNGDLLVKVYLTNTGALNMALQYLNMKLYVEGSIEAGGMPSYQLLTFENGVALFNIEGGTAESYTVEVIGGSYRLISGDPDEWGEGWSITPEFYLEVAQRGVI